MTNVARYANGHLFTIDGNRTALMTQIGQVLGDLNEDDYANLDRYYGRINQLGDVADERNCKLYVDAEQTFIQAAIESFGQQMTHKYNLGPKVVIMNGYQCYLKRMEALIPMEVRASDTLGFNLGIKLIRGAYMNEEREYAADNNLPSPVHESIEDTHACYNANVEHIVKNMKQTDMLFVASHNTDSCDIAMRLTEQRGLKDSQRVIFGQLKGFSD